MRGIKLKTLENNQKNGNLVFEIDFSEIFQEI